MNTSAVSGYYVIGGLSVYCDIVNYINGLNFSDCYEIFQNRSPRKHIWTYAGSLTSDNVPFPWRPCPCHSDNTVASWYKKNFIEDDYYCESDISSYVSGNTHRWQPVLYVNLTLWDG